LGADPRAAKQDPRHQRKKAKNLPCHSGERPGTVNAKRPRAVPRDSAHWGARTRESAAKRAETGGFLTRKEKKNSKERQPSAKNTHHHRATALCKTRGSQTPLGKQQDLFIVACRNAAKDGEKTSAKGLKAKTVL